MKYKNVIKSIFFILIFINILLFVSPILIPYNNIHKRWRQFYKLPRNSVDVLFMGSSHSFASFNPQIFKRELGIKSFNLSSNSEIISQTYFNLAEALKSQKPKIVVIETFRINASKGSFNPIMRDSNFESMKMSVNKLKAMTALYKKDEYLNELLPIIKYHNNWKNFSQQLKTYQEYKKTPNSTDGYERLVSDMTKETAEKYKKMPKDNSEFVFTDYSIEYIDKIIKLCEKENVQIVFVNAPMFKEYLNKINYISRYKKTNDLVAGKYKKPYIDFDLLYDDLKLTRSDFTNEFNDFHHLNYKGSEKVSLYLANWLKDNFKEVLQ